MRYAFQQHKSHVEPYLDDVFSEATTLIASNMIVDQMDEIWLCSSTLAVAIDFEVIES